jgi:hypothetical protein
MSLRIRPIATLAVAAPAILLAALLPALPAAARMGPSWVTGPDYSPPLGTTGAEWRDVTATGPADIWAVGVRRTPAETPLTARWNGKGWTAVPTPAAPAGQRYNLTAVDAIAPDDVWAVGSAASATRNAAALHYDGAWTAVTLPSPPIGQSSELSDVDMTATGGWAVGYATSGVKPPRALVLRRQGANWTRDTVPDGDATSTELSAVFTRAPDDVWAVGSQVRLDGRRVGMIMHWNGVSWQEQAAPVVGDADEETFLASVSASTPGDVWAVGRRCREGNGLESCRPLALHLTGGAWTVVPTNGEESELTEVITFSPTDAWVIGYAGESPLNETDYAEHWNGEVFIPDATGPADPGGPITFNGEPASALSAATAIPGTGAIWAVGWTRDPVRGGSHVVHRG